MNENMATMGELSCQPVQEMCEWAGPHAKEVVESGAEQQATQAIRGEYFSGERPLYGLHDAQVSDCVFGEGESPLKEARHVSVDNCVFKWKYPFWYADTVAVENTVLETVAHAGMWYVKNFSMKDCALQAGKLFRRSSGIFLTNVHFANATETFWNCEDVHLERVEAQGTYFGMNSRKIIADHLDLIGDYAFDGASDILITNSRIVAKDAFWNSTNVTVRDSFISGEYLGWNSTNLTLENCVVVSDQGLCYIKGLKIRNTKLLRTDLAFELCSDIDAEITSSIDSVKNPVSGRIVAPRIDGVILDPAVVDPAQTEIISGGERISESTMNEEHAQHIAGYNE